MESKNFLDAVKIFDKLAQSGLPEAQFNLSLLYSSGLGTPKNYKTALYWSWKAHLNDHPTAINQINEIFDLITEALRDTVANQIIDELLAVAKAGEQNSALKLGKTYTDLLVVPNTSLHMFGCRLPKLTVWRARVACLVRFRIS